MQTSVDTCRHWQDLLALAKPVAKPVAGRYTRVKVQPFPCFPHTCRGIKRNSELKLWIPLLKLNMKCYSQEESTDSTCLPQLRAQFSFLCSTLIEGESLTISTPIKPSSFLTAFRGLLAFLSEVNCLISGHEQKSNFISFLFYSFTLS